MFQKVKKSIMITIASLTLLAPGLVPSLAAVATADTISQSLCQGTNIASSGSNSTDCTTNAGNGSLKSLATQVVNVFSIIVGVVAVIMVIYGGFKYITSGGEAGNVSGAKNTLIYAVVGLIIVALAQFIVHFVLSTANNTNLN